MTVIDLKQAKPKRANLVDLGKSSDAGRFFSKMTRDIIADLGGRRQLTRMELELIQVFCGAATQARYLNHQIFLGEIAEVDFSGYANMASTMLRIASKLGMQRREIKGRTLGELLVADHEQRQKRRARRESDQ